MERTLTIVKPDAVQMGNSGAIISAFEQEGFRILATKMLHLSKEDAEGFYAVHKERPFFRSLVDFMTEGPVITMVLEADDAIEKLRNVMGPTDPVSAGDTTIRKRFGTSIERNAIHGSDAPETAAFEISYFFNELELVSSSHR